MKKSYLTFAALAVLAIGTIVYFVANDMGNELSLSAHELSTQSTVVEVGDRQFLTELATTTEQHSQGLSERKTLKTGTGMLFVFKPAQDVSFWMYKMEFPLDMIFIYDGKIISIERNVPAPNGVDDPNTLPTYSATKPVDYVLEINAGEAASLKIGDTVNVRSINQT